MLGIASVAGCLYLSSLYSYLLFHSVVEIATIAIAFALFSLYWHTRKYLDSGYLRLIGIGYGFIAIIDLVHTLSYKGLEVFPGATANLPTQCWVAARYLQAATLAMAPFFVKGGPSDRTIVGGYFLAVVALLTAIFNGYFPDCYIEGKGLTQFKVYSEYVISAIMLFALYLLRRNMCYFSSGIYKLLVASIVSTILSELLFTSYVSVYGAANMLGHYFKLAQFYLIYQAILVAGLERPFELIFRDLKQTEAALLESQNNLENQVRERTEALTEACLDLRKSEAKYRRFLDTASEGVWVLGTGHDHRLCQRQDGGNAGLRGRKKSWAAP